MSLNYERIERQLASADIESSAAEAHGVICGLLCAGANDAEQVWMLELLPEDSVEGDLLLEECKSALMGLYQSTIEGIRDSDFGFSAFLPDDDNTLVVRGRAVADWCQGFMYGLGLAGTATEEKLSGDANEALQSLSEISQMDVAALENTSEEEFELAEVTEFLWVVAILIHGEMVGDQVKNI